MDIIAKISKGSKMDQIYIPRNRESFPTGSLVIIKLLEEEQKAEDKPYFYDVKKIEPLKVEIIKNIFRIIDKYCKNENIIITGSFLELGFCFNDIDIIIITDKKANQEYIQDKIREETVINSEVIILDKETLINGLKTDPLYNLMLSRCISKKRIFYNSRQKINYKILDLHLIQSKSLIQNFDYLKGIEKYKLIRNMIAISLFINKKEINKENIDREIKSIFKVEIEDIKDNKIKKSFIKIYEQEYKKIFNKIMRGIKNGSKQE